MKKSFQITGIILLLVFITTYTIYKEHEKEVEKINNIVGLASSLGALKEKYGNAKYISGGYFFEDEHIFVSTPITSTNEDLVSHLSIYFESTDNPYRTLDEVLELGNNLIPPDAVKKRQNDFIINDDYTETIIEYKSDLLAKLINNQELYGDAEIGTFVLHLVKYTGKEFDIGYTELTISTGNPYRERYKGYDFFY